METADIILYHYQRQFFGFLKFLYTNTIQFSYLQFTHDNILLNLPAKILFSVYIPVNNR